MSTGTRVLRRAVIGLATCSTIAALVTVATGPPVSAGAAAFTSVNGGRAPAGDGTGHCVRGSPAVSCNGYDGPTPVWLKGGPAGTALCDGDYFFAVVRSGGQTNPNDNSAGLLPSDA